MIELRPANCRGHTYVTEAFLALPQVVDVPLCQFLKRRFLGGRKAQHFFLLRGSCFVADLAARLGPFGRTKNHVSVRPAESERAHSCVACRVFITPRDALDWYLD